MRSVIVLCEAELSTVHFVSRILAAVTTAAHAQQVSSDISHMTAFLKCVFFFTALANYEAVDRFGDL